jgi:hypothetical protein
MKTSKAEMLILLVDLPGYSFLRFHDKRRSQLSRFGETAATYGGGYEIKTEKRNDSVIPLCHSKQADQLGDQTLNGNCCTRIG